MNPAQSSHSGIRDPRSVIPSPSLAPRIRLTALLLFAGLAFLWFMLCRQLSYEWAANEQYSYGWFVPFFAAFLFWLRLEEWNQAGSAEQGARSRERGARSGELAARKNRFLFPALCSLLPALCSALLLLLLLPVRLFEVANPDWRPLSWMHALIVVGLTLLLIGYWGGKAAVRHFAFPVCFILVAVPWITPIEGPLVQGLMRLVASVATEMLTLFGIPAQLEGSLIRVSNGVVGVSEACSGVRSLQTSLMIGLLFGELKRLTIARRFALVGAALAIALFANFGRAFFLVWIAATENLAAVERWHDVAGYAIVGLVFLGTVVCAAALARGRRSQGEAGTTQPHLVAVGDTPASRPISDLRTSISGFPFPAPRSLLLACCCWLLLVEAGVDGWYRWHERNFVETTSWTVRWPESAPGFHTLPIDDNVRSTLRYDAGREVSWQSSLTTLPNEQTTPANLTLFFFRWDAGSASILRARAHRPDICLPNTGWRMTHDDGVRSYGAGPGFALPFRHFRFARDLGGGRQIFAQAFFCQREDRVPLRATDRFDATSGHTGNWLRGDRVRVVREGLRNQGQQVMELVMMMPNEITQEGAEAEFARLLPRLVHKEEF